MLILQLWISEPHPLEEKFGSSVSDRIPSSVAWDQLKASLLLLWASGCFSNTFSWIIYRIIYRLISSYHNSHGIKAALRGSSIA
jgi:hypothetical protein